MAERMTISGRRSTERQESFWPKPIDSGAMNRNECGEFVEELAATVLRGHRLKTQGNVAYCPDIQLASDPNTFLECKSVGKNAHAIVYEGRRLKDRRFVSQGRRLHYSFWHHKAIATGASDQVELRQRLAGAIQFAVVLPFGVVDAILETRRLKCLNKHYAGGGNELGYGNRSKGYGDGRTLTMAQLRQACDCSVTVGPLAVQGVALPWFEVYTLRKYRRWLLE